MKKKLLLFTAAAAIAFCICSCEKTRTCTCRTETWTERNGVTSNYNSSINFVDVIGRDHCSSLDINQSEYDGIYPNNYTSYFRVKCN